MITYALIDKSTKDAVQSWTQIPGRIEVSDKLRVDGAAVGWVDENYEIVEVSTPDPAPGAATVSFSLLDEQETVFDFSEAFETAPVALRL